MPKNKTSFLKTQKGGFVLWIFKVLLLSNELFLFKSMEFNPQKHQ